MRLILLNATIIFGFVLSEDDAQQDHKNYIKKSHPNDKKIKVVHHKSRPKNKLQRQSKKQESKKPDFKVLDFSKKKKKIFLTAVMFWFAQVTLKVCQM